MYDYIVILFHSTGHAVRGEKILQEANISCRMVPVPRHISSDCGSCLRLNAELQAAAEKALEENGCEIEGIHPWE